jgi:hypothetical protein
MVNANLKEKIHALELCLHEIELENSFMGNSPVRLIECDIDDRLTSEPQSLYHGVPQCHCPCDFYFTRPPPPPPRFLQPRSLLHSLPQPIPREYVVLAATP